MKQRRRLHWAWRVAAVVSWLYTVTAITAVDPWAIIAAWVSDAARVNLGLAGSLRAGIVVSTVYYAPALVLAFVVYGLLTRYYGPGDTETRCRTCRYILRGITEPRCPECGEAI